MILRYSIKTILDFNIILVFALVSPFSNTFDDKGLLYFVDDFLKDKIKIGQLVEFPLKNKIDFWIVLDLVEKTDLDLAKIKPIISIKFEISLLKSYQNKLIFFISSYYFSSIHNSLNLFFPKNLKDKLLKDKFSLDTSEKEIFSYDFNFDKTLNTFQQKIYEDISKENHKNILFYGVTWSWKTEVYIKLIKDYIEKGKQVLLLVPEIILTNQLWERIKKVFWKEVFVITSDISDAKKTSMWVDISLWNAKIIVWTRSALFYPYDDLGLIIIDEEHDESYISDSSPRYKSDEIALEISRLNWVKVILWSWTPSIKNMYKALKWEFELFQLLEKY